MFFLIVLVLIIISSIFAILYARNSRDYDSEGEVSGFDIKIIE